MHIVVPTLAPQSHRKIAKGTIHIAPLPNYEKKLKICSPFIGSSSPANILFSPFPPNFLGKEFFPTMECHEDKRRTHSSFLFPLFFLSFYVKYVKELFPYFLPLKKIFFIFPLIC